MTSIAEHLSDFEPVGRRSKCPADRPLLGSACPVGYLALASDPSFTLTLMEASKLG